MIIFIIAIYLIVTFIFTAIGIEKQSDILKIFTISFFLTPLIGMFFIKRNKKRSSKITYCYCSECDYIFPVKMSYCPICAENKKKIRLTKYVSPYDATKLIRSLELS